MPLARQALTPVLECYLRDRVCQPRSRFGSDLSNDFNIMILRQRGRTCPKRNRTEAKAQKGVSVKEGLHLSDGCVLKAELYIALPLVLRGVFLAA